MRHQKFNPWSVKPFAQRVGVISPERHFHSEAAILPILVQVSWLGAAQDQNPCFQKAA
jgi:hypothetical protein